MVDPVRSESARQAPILDERWELLEARVDQLLQRIRPNRGSELRRARVAEYVRSLVARCFKSEVRESAQPVGPRPITACTCSRSVFTARLRGRYR